MLAALLLAAHVDDALPAPRSAAHSLPTDFVAENAYRFLLNLTSIGPRVAGSYENDVLGVGVAVGALREIARTAQPHHRLEVEVHRGDGAFPLAFLDGMNHVYRDVVSVVARLSAAPAPAPRRARARPALLLNCHIDTVPDSPGASDDAAGCSVVVETLRALAAERAPHAHDVLAVLNGGEENVLQAAHSVVTAHRWARAARAFLNLEACGAGGREVLFQAGPHDVWLLDEYAAHAPHPFASSLAQDLFRSGLVPADTDFRIYRDHGRLSGVDFAWSANGYVYHTPLDAAAAVAPAALQRTGDNVLALVRALLRGQRLDAPPDTAAALPVYFDVLGLAVVRLGAEAALLGAAAVVGAALLAVRADGAEARARLGLAPAAWARLSARAALAVVGAAAAGVASAALAGLALHAAGARLAWYARPALAGGVFAPAALGGAAWAGLRLAPTVPGGARGWWRARLLGGGATLAAAALTAACAAAGLRSGFVPALWAAAGAAAALGGERRWALRWAAWALLPALQTTYLALAFLRMFIPVMGRAGPAVAGLPPDMAMGGVVGALCVAAGGWLLPLWLATRRRGAVAAACGAVWAAASLAALLAAPYSPRAPQRLMVFHTRLTVHSPAAPPPQHLFWVPELDANTHLTFHKLFSGGSSTSEAECERWVYCGVPYYLPVRRLVPAWLRAPAPPPPPAAPRLRVAAAARRSARGWAVDVRADGGAPHLVLIVRLAPGGRLERVERGEGGEGAEGAEGAPLEAAAEGARRTYFFSLFDARARPRRLVLHARWADGAAAPAAGGVAQLSLAAHALFGAGKAPAGVAPPPPTVALTAWTVDHHLLEV